MNQSRAFWRIALPCARPAIAGGLALVLMEALADFGVAAYFGLPTFSTGIFRSWLSMGDKAAALKLAGVMLLFVIALIAIEAMSRKGQTHSADAAHSGEPLITLSKGQGIAAMVFCAVPVVLGFLVPLGVLVSHALQTGDGQSAATLGSYAWLCFARSLAGGRIARALGAGRPIDHAGRARHIRLERRLAA
jgi:iron(III) transport system permease protein